MPQPDVAVVILTMGDRPEALARAVESVRSQRDVTFEILVVANGVAPAAIGDLPAVTVLGLDENVGIPEGRNVGAAATTADVIAFLDDDAMLLDGDVLARTLARFRADARLGAVAWRIVDERGATARRHVPRLGGGSAARSGPVTAFLGGACAVRRSAFVAVGSYAGDFLYAMEETDLAWRLIDAGWGIHYDAECRVEHPAVDPSRHADGMRHTARNRVWAAHRNLPLLLAPVYVGSWLLVVAVRSGPRAGWTALRGVIEGVRTPLGPRRPMAWRTVVQLSRLGRPPVL